MAPQPPGRYFDLSRLEQVPDVPQTPLERYMPPRGVPERTQDLVSNRRVRRQVGEIMDEGALQGAPRWYNTEPLREAFVAELGPERGAAAYRQYMGMVSATSPRSRVPENIRNASYYYSLLRRGEALPVPGVANPAPYGHIAQRVHQTHARSIANNEWNSFQNPKPISFLENLTGNQAPATIDAHAVNLPAMIARDPRWLATETRTPQRGGDIERIFPRRMHAEGDLTMEQALQRPAVWGGAPEKTEYAALERMYQELARARGLTPAQGQASAWIGGGSRTGLQSAPEPWMQTFEEVLLRTAAERGQKPSQVLRELIRGRAPLLSVPAAAAFAGSLLDRYEAEGS
jgi:hypothetical protein